MRGLSNRTTLFAVETLEPKILRRLPGFKRRMDWFIQNRPDLTKNVARMDAKGEGERMLLSITNAEQLRRVPRIMLDEEQFLSPFGIRSSRVITNVPRSVRLSTTRLTGWNTIPANPLPGCLAAIRIGGDLSGFPLTS